MPSHVQTWVNPSVANKVSATTTGRQKLTHILQQVEFVQIKAKKPIIVSRKQTKYKSRNCNNV